MSDSRKILVVEDDEQTLLFISQILENHDYQFMVARDGAAALEVMKADPPSLVLLDIMMPRKSGVTVYQQMTKDDKLKKIPIIFVTGASEVTGVDMQTGDEKPKETYADDFARGIGHMIKDKLDGFTPHGLVEKPIDPPVLIGKIKEILP
ncbi:MAG: response regulator [Candidatus Latescibacterota bacterium]|nr:MAG: response regulator [Candidatus Latescibacterota bacterium]